MKIAVIYARYSSDAQTEQSIEGQLRVCEEFAKKNDYLIVDTYIDRAMTGTNDNRYDFQRMLKDSAKKQWQVVLVYKLDRFARNRYESILNRKRLTDNGVSLVSAMENIPDTPEGKLFTSIIEGYNEYFSEDVRQKVKRGMRETRMKGLYQGGGIPYGYKVENRKIIIDEETAEVVRYIFEQYALGVFTKDIIASLNNRGILHYGKPWAMNTVYGILGNEKYSGKYYHEEELIENMYPRIVSDETFQIVRKKIKQNKHGKRSVRAVYLLRHKLRCGYCGQPISADTGTARDKTVVHYYKCLGRKKYRNGCQKTILKKEFLEEMVVNSIIEELEKPSNIDNIVKGIMKRQDQKPDERGALSLLIKEKQRVDRTLDNMMSALERGIVSRTANKRINELENQQDELERQILIERNKIAPKLTESEIREFYARALKLLPQMLISYCVKEIVLYNDKMQIYLNSPTQNGPDDGQGFSFYEGQKFVKCTTLNQPMPFKVKIEVNMFIV